MHILNLRDGEIVPHRLLLIHGVDSSTSLTKIKNTTTGDELETVTASNGEFKAVIPLIPGDNFLTFHTTSVTYFRINYRRPEFAERVRLIYVIPADSDGRFRAPDNYPNDTETACSKIALIGELIQLFLAEEIRRRYEKFRSTFRLEYDKDNISSPRCYLLRSKLKTVDLCHLQPNDLFWTVVKEIFSSSIYEENLKFLTFLSFTDFDKSRAADFASISSTEEAKRNSAIGYVNLGCGDVAVVNGGGLWTVPRKWHEIQETFACKKSVENFAFNANAVGECFSVALGSATHELCHTFDLAHTNTGIMSYDFVHIARKFVACSRSDETKSHLENSSLAILHRHRWFNGTAKTPSDIILKKRCVISRDGIAYAELRKDGSVFIYWTFEIFCPSVWMVPDEAINFIFDVETSERSVFLMILSSTGNIKKFKRTDFVK